ncbi:unnamed protein product [Lymnaea stagnalis]|uniref:Cilia- and flagella-associated protein 97 n=1 Tax=Lymnaea stagnalis TaxID=6523 RepID=A0AAV2H2X8_LYMST
MDTLGMDESVDFDFFETPRSPKKDSKNNGQDKTSLSKPPAHPRPNNDSPKDSSKSGHPLKLEKSIAVRSSSAPRADYFDDSDSDGNRSPSREGDRSRDSISSKSSVTISSHSSSRSSSPGRNNSKPLKNQERISKKSSNSSFSSDDSSVDERPSNPTAKSRKLQNRSNSRHLSDEEEKAEHRKEKTDSLCHDDGDFKKLPYKNKSQAWGEKSSSELYKQKNTNLDRPKTAKNRLRDKTDKTKPNKSDSLSDTLSDSDITDVSPIDSPRNLSQAKVRDRSKGQGITAAGDGHTHFRPIPVTELDLRDLDADFDRNTDLDSFDLHILMKAVGELEKQKRLKANSRRVMFAPTSLHRTEKANYTFDDNKTRDIERENNRLLKEIVRHVNTGGEHRRGHIRGSATHKLTASAVNRERDIRRIESENLAFLKRLKKVKPTKAISRENQLKEYQSTMLHGVPIASLHPMTRSGQRSGFDDSASSMSSIHSAVSSVRSVNSRYSSRPVSAVRTPSSATRYFYQQFLQYLYGKITSLGTVIVGLHFLVMYI